MSLRENIPISRETPAAPSSPWSCFETWSRPRPLSPRPGAATSRSFGARTSSWIDWRRSLPARNSRSIKVGATGPRRRSLWATPPGAEFPIVERPASPTPLPRHPDPGGPTPQRRPPIDPSDSHLTILKGPFDETPPTSPISTRAHHHQRVSAPGPAHAETPTPQN